MERVLGGLGVSWHDELVYRALLTHPRATLAELAVAAGWAQARVRRHVRTLETLGLLTRTPTRPVRFTPAAPDAAIEVLALHRQEEIERARVGAAQLAEQFRAMADDSGRSPVTVVRGREASAQAFFQAQQSTRNEVLILDRPPYVVEPVVRQRNLQQELLRKGVSYRTIYDESSLDTSDKLTLAHELAALGEQSRVMPRVPLKMVITDRKSALIPLTMTPQREAVVLHPSALLDGLMTLFELLWQQATPLWRPLRHTPGLSKADEELLMLCSLGLTDQAIARRLAVAQRTVERRMRRIMDELGATTRFQAGMQAARRASAV